MLFLPAPDRLTGEPAVIFALPAGGYSRGYYDMHFDGHLGYSQPAVVWTMGHMIGLQLIADQIRAQQCANAERSHTAWVYPQSKDEPKLVVALSESAENPNTFRPWLTHRELGQVANVWMGVLLFRMRRKAKALDRFDEVLAEPVALLGGILRTVPAAGAVQCLWRRCHNPVEPQRSGNLCGGDV